MFTISETALRQLDATKLQTLLQGAESAYMRISCKERNSPAEQRTASSWFTLRARCLAEQKRRQEKNYALAMSHSLFPQAAE